MYEYSKWEQAVKSWGDRLYNGLNLKSEIVMQDLGKTMGTLFLFAVGCAPSWAPPDVAERLVSGQVRAGWVNDEEALFGGISAEGQLGDIKIYNDRVQFIIQGIKQSHFYIQTSGGVIDADIVRPQGQLGRDMVDEWMPLFGLGRLQCPDSLSIVDSGSITGRAIVRVTGRDCPMMLLAGALESPGLFASRGLAITTDYILEANASLLEVRSIVTPTLEPVTLELGDVMLTSREASRPWEPGTGSLAPSEQPAAWMGFTGFDNASALGLFPETAQTLDSGGLWAVAEVAPVAFGFGETQSVEVGQTVMYRRYYGVGPDLATLTDAFWERKGVETEQVTGEVQAPDGPVSGALVNIAVQGQPFTLAVTDDDGGFSAHVPLGAEATVLAEGRGRGVFLDLPEGTTSYSPYACEKVQKETLQAFESGASSAPKAVGRGAARWESPLLLQEPATVVVEAADGLPFEVRLSLQGDSGDVAAQWLTPRPDGGTVLGWARDGSIELVAEPGSYEVYVHRGLRFERVQQSIELEAGQRLELSVELEQAYEAEGWLLGDPHSHAAPSGDTYVPMEDRLIVSASTGIQLHFGTDHDHIVDYGPLLEPLGLSEVLQTVVSDEMSSIVRGHANLYPTRVVRDLPNFGAPLWWDHTMTSTEQWYEELRERQPLARIQINHPYSNMGLASAAAWSSGGVGKEDHWTTNFDLIEVMNGAGTGPAVTMYMELINQGVLIAPTGVSDAHRYTDGYIGLSATFFGLGVSEPTDYSDELLRQTIDARRTIVTRGPYLSMSIPPGSVVMGSASLEVQALSPSWVLVDELVLYRDGLLVETVPGTQATFTLAAEADASFVVVAQGSTPMGGVWGSKTPWALASAILLDVDQDGWKAPHGLLD